MPLILKVRIIFYIFTIPSKEFAIAILIMTTIFIFTAKIISYLVTWWPLVTLLSTEVVLFKTIYLQLAPLF